jgi:hypothetical protein
MFFTSGGGFCGLQGSGRSNMSSGGFINDVNSEGQIEQGNWFL